MIANIQAWIDAVSYAIKKGMSLGEAQNSVNLLNRYPPNQLSAERIAQIQRMNVASVYQVLKKRSET
jgi:hypothetical protein